MEHILTPARRAVAARLAAQAAAAQAKLAKASADAIEKEALAAAGSQGVAMGKLIVALVDEEQAVATYQAAQIGLAPAEELEPLAVAVAKAEAARAAAMRPFLALEDEKVEPADVPADRAASEGDA